MRPLVHALVASAAAFGLASCSAVPPDWTYAPASSGPAATAPASGSPSATAPLDPESALLRAHVEHPDLVTRIAPLNHLDPLHGAATTTAVLARTSQRAPLATVADGDTISAADLETAYETQFCQLNSSRGVTMDAPQCQANIAYIKGQGAAGSFDLGAKPILNNPLGVTGVKFDVIHYSTDVELPQGDRTFAVSGGLMLPQGISGDKVKGVVTYFHGTTFNKAVVGSNYSGNGETRLLAEVFASQGYIVVVPDYVGQGDDYKDVHPYVLYPRVSAKTAVDMLAAVAPTIRDQYQLDAGAQLKLFSAGYSEGGSYSLWFSSYVHELPSALDALYALTHSVGMEGAYSTSSVTKGFLFDNVEQGGANTYTIHNQAVTNIVKPLLSADAFLSYATYQLNGDTASVFNPDFYAMKCTLANLLPAILQAACNVGGTNVDMAGAFALEKTDISTALLASAIRKSANGSTYPYDLVLSWKNSVNSLVSATLLGDAGQATLDAALRAADANLEALPDKAVSVITLDLDSVVTPNNYKSLVAAYPAKIRDSYVIPSHSLQVVSQLSYLTQNAPVYVDVDHLQAPAFEFLYALNTFNQFAR